MSDAADMRRSRILLRRTSTALVAFMGFALATGNAQQFTIATYAQIGPNSIDFGQSAAGAPFSPAPGYGTFDVISAGAGFFSLEGVTNGESGSIQSLDELAGPTDMPFLTFSGGASNISLYATELARGATSGPLTLAGLPFGTALSFELFGDVSSSETGALGIFTLTCSAEIVGMSPAQLLGSLAGGTPVDTPLSCTAAVAQTAQQAALSIVDAVNALNAQGALNGGQHKSLVKELQQAITLMAAGKNAAAIQNLDLFIGEVADLLNSGVLTPSQGKPLISAAKSVIAVLS